MSIGPKLVRVSNASGSVLNEMNELHGLTMSVLTGREWSWK